MCATSPTNPTAASREAVAWPSLPLDEWRDTCQTLHMWTQIVGKVRLAQAPMVNHWWQVPLYVNARGLTTSAIPYGSRTFEVEVDFVDHAVVIRTDEGGIRTLALEPRSVAEFYGEFMSALRELDLDIRIWTRPVEVEEAIPFEQDHEHASYDPEYAGRFWHALVQSDRVLHRFRSGFIGKASPVHFFWGSFDLALTYFSGRPAPEHPGGMPNLADWVTRESYSHEVASFGWWPGGGGIDEAAYYAYAYPEPVGFEAARVRPDAAYYHSALREFVLPYAAVREAEDPDAALLAFFSSTYDAAAELGGWDREALERAP